MCIAQARIESNSIGESYPLSWPQSLCYHLRRTRACILASDLTRLPGCTAACKECLWGYQYKQGTSHLSWGCDTIQQSRRYLDSDQSCRHCETSFYFPLECEKTSSDQKSVEESLTRICNSFLTSFGRLLRGVRLRKYRVKFKNTITLEQCW